MSEASLPTGPKGSRKRRRARRKSRAGAQGAGSAENAAREDSRTAERGRPAEAARSTPSPPEIAASAPTREPAAAADRSRTRDLEIGIVFDDRRDPPERLDRPDRPDRPTARATLLDAASARRLASEARKRERESREALEATRRALASELPPGAANEPTTTLRTASAEPTVSPAASGPEAQPPTSGRESTGWQRIALHAKPSDARPLAVERPAPRVARSDTAERLEIDRESPDASRRLEAARARELEYEATLEIARDTASSQRRDLALLREQLRGREAEIADLRDTLAAAAARSEPDRIEREQTRRALDAATREIESLRERLDRSQSQLESQAADRIELEQRLAERDRLIVARGEQLDALRDRFEAQERELFAARHEYELERARHSRSLEILAQLRTTLASIDAIPVETRSKACGSPGSGSVASGSTESGPDGSVAAGAPGQSATAPARPAHDESLATPATPATPMSPRAFETTRPADAAAGVHEQASDAPRHDPRTSSSGTRTTASAMNRLDAAALAVRALPPIFDAWQDDQIRRQFGPMGIDGFCDLLRIPLARGARSRSDEQSIVLIGRGAGGVAGAIAEGLIQNEVGAFRIHVADSLGGDGLESGACAKDSPLRELVSPLDFPTDPAALDALLEALRPRVVVARDFLSQQTEVAPWLACLARATEGGTSLVFSEGTGIESRTPPAAMVQIGERIWELMPARYTRVEGTSSPFESWTEAFEACAPRHPNQLVAHLREDFRPEMFTQFGYLAEPFLASAIGWNFDVDAPRDRRFLHQVADLDDRKIEAGVAPALHLVALVDPLAED